MDNTKPEVLIIGAGLTGLTLAYLLQKRNISVKIIEARQRIGGRIYTKKGADTTTQEMGATWLSKQHTSLLTLLKEFNLAIFEQRMGRTAIYEPSPTSAPQLVELPPNNDPSFRIVGGSSELITVLKEQLVPESFHLGEFVQAIEEVEGGVQVKTNIQTLTASRVVSTLPPYLFYKKIAVQPALPESLTKIMGETHTWMGESIKVCLTYEKPFWRTAGKSGTLFSHVGPVPEMYDHSNAEDTRFALKGFLDGSYFSVTKEERLERILAQLTKYFGAVVRDFLTYEEVVWQKEPFTFLSYSSPMIPHRNNGHLVYQAPYLDGKLWIAGSETARNSPGYMEGAVRSAVFISAQL
jgi:monoamine oxidase